MPTLPATMASVEEKDCAIRYRKGYNIARQMMPIRISLKIVKAR